MILSQEYQEKWSLTKKAVFYCIVSYFSIYMFLMFSSSLFESQFRWVGKTILGIDYDYNTSGFGSGDHTYAYITLFINFVLAIISSLFWFFIDHKRESYNKLLYWFIVVLRVFLVFFMFTYGFVKIIQLQFPYPSLGRMLEPLGNFSPMGLAWTYLGYSEGYNLFMGIMEVLGGLLLIPRRTSTLGAFITMGVMTHVAVMNFMFDIPVKLFSVHLTLIAMFIFSTDIRRFISVFIKNDSTEAYNFYNPISDKTYHKVIFWMKLVFTIGLIGLFIMQGWGNSRSKANKEKPNLYGIWETTQLIKDGDTIPPLITDKNYWRYLIVDKKEKAIIKMMNDEKRSFKFKVDSTTRKIILYGPGEKSETPNFTYEYLDSETINLKGQLYLYDYEIQLKKKNFLLDTRGFNWINETPFNK